MKDNIVRFAFILLSLVIGAALEDMLPSVASVGIPLLLGMVLFFAMTVSSPAWILAAAAGGGFEEAIAALPPATAIVFFVAAAMAVRFFRAPVAWSVVAYPAYQVWLGIILGGSGAFGRVLAALPVGTLVLLLLFAVLSRAWRKAGADA